MTFDEWKKGYIAKYKAIERRPIINDKEMGRITHKKHDRDLSNIRDGEVEKQLSPEIMKKIKWGEKIVKRTIYQYMYKKRRKK